MAPEISSAGDAPTLTAAVVQMCVGAPLLITVALVAAHGTPAWVRYPIYVLTTLLGVFTVVWLYLAWHWRNGRR